MIDFLRIFAYNIIIMVGKGTITMHETRILEFKETITNTFLKTVSAFSNYNGGTILFGVDDNGNVKGLPDVSIPIEISILFGNSEHPFPERKNMPFRSRVQPFI